MANIKSAKKRILVNNKKNLRNRSVKSALKTAIKKYDAAVASGDKELAASMLPKVSSAIDKAAAKGVIHKNAANRKKIAACFQAGLIKNGYMLFKAPFIKAP